METITSQNALTMSEYLNQIIQEEEAANKYLSKPESNECTYSKGYITQTVFGCTTCNKKGGMCLGCYLNCHLDHETFEIGLKRNFRCDCGTESFGDRNFDYPCSLLTEKPEKNTKNTYDHNFEGKWCICNSTYDPNLFMIRCLCCLDYYHLHHLNISEQLQHAIEDEERFTIMVCGKCMVNKFKFLLCYNDKNMIYKEQEMISLSENKELNEQPEIIPTNGKVLLGKRTRSLEEACLVKETIEGPLKEYKEEVPIFLKDGWQNYLCFCDECLKIYKDNEVYDLLTKEEENILDPEEGEEEKLNSQDNQSTAESNVTLESHGENSVYDKAMKEMSKLDYMTQVYIASTYRDFYEDFKNYFAKFKEENKVITSENVQEFFEHLKGKKKEEPLD